MNINRHNYESFFMLYIDKELSGEERQAVDAFVKENADLKVELEQLQLSILPQEAFSFENKTALLKEEVLTEEEIEKLLLLLDGEISAEETLVLEQKINQNPSWAAAWTALKKTKLHAEDDTLVFENKELLYRKEEIERPLYFMLRWAAAAAIIGIVFFTGFKMLQKTPTNLPAEIAIEKNKKPTTNLPATNNNNVAENSIPQETTASIKKPTVSLAANAKKQIINTSPTKNNFKKDNKLVTEDAEQNPLEKAPVLLAAKTEFTIKNYQTPDANPDLTAKLPAKRPELIDINIMEVQQQNKFALSSAFNGNISGDRILYMDKEVVEKTKVGKFLKKVKNSLSRDIEIESGKTIKIAGFEIAMQ